MKCIAQHFRRAKTKSFMQRRAALVDGTVAFVRPTPARKDILRQQLKFLGNAVRRSKPTP